MFNRETDISVATSTLVKITVLGLILFFAWTIKDILILLLISITLASALEPLVEMLLQWRIPRSVSVVAVYIIALAFVVLIGFLVTPPVIQQFQQVTNNDFLASEISSKIGPGSFLSEFNLTEIVSKNVQSLANQFNDLSENFFSRTLGVFNGFIEIVTVLVVSFYLLAEKNGMKNFVYTLVPKESQPKALHIITRIQKKIGLWMIGQIIVSAIIFAITFIALTVLGVKYALVLAILSGFFELIPYIGPFVAAIPAIFFAFLQSPTLAVVVMITYLVLSKIEGYVLVPKIMQKTVGVSPLVILVAILIGFKLAGIFGILLAVPVVAVMQVIIEEWDTLKDKS
ncbi:MAG: AI-2E family transporter [Patescibacteria group bacterium]